MKIFLFTFPIFLFFTGTNSDFAADLATFINETVSYVYLSFSDMNNGCTDGQTEFRTAFGEIKS